MSAIARHQLEEAIAAVLRNTFVQLNKNTSTVDTFLHQAGTIINASI
ncbi:hypothetical protein [Aerosakkonema funiforme]|uniref:Uncharacterized protein n=1 Tax=Aerosakkonema funiforme FACHB-1375 TaxID=2949571 RepID=A0A926ZER1_9CYAN|nr:hypothetical protein [Aerosakkonema funiforme]MBD2180035.1 hypothetical protein [Aerosakkonema funiforme FACHB-1375]